MLNSPEAALRLCVSSRVKTSSSEVCPGVSLTSCRASDLGASLVCNLGWTSAATKCANPSMLVTTAGWWESEEAKARNPEGGRAHVLEGGCLVGTITRVPPHPPQPVRFFFVCLCGFFCY